MAETVETFLKADVDFEELINKLSFDEASATFAASQQPMLFLKAARLRVKTMRAEMAADANLEQTKAKVSQNIRLAYQGVKTTEGGIAEMVKLDENVVAAEKAFRAAAAQAELGKLLVEAYKHRRDAIRVIAESNIAEGNSPISHYDTTPEMAKVRRDAREAIRLRKQNAVDDDN